MPVSRTGLTAAAKVTSHWEHAEQLVYVLILYAAIAILDGLVLQPYFMRRQTKVPMWASILTPIVLGFIVPLWGVLLAPPLLAILYAYKARWAKNASPMPPRNLSC